MANGMLYMSGQIALIPETGEVVDEGIEAQTIRVLKNMEGVLSEAGLTFDDVVKTTVFLTDMEDFGVVNSIYGEKFAENAPARSCVQVAGLPKAVLPASSSFHFNNSVYIFLLKVSTSF